MPITVMRPTGDSYGRRGGKRGLGALTTYTVEAGQSPVYVASKFGITVDYLLAGLNGYGHGENGTRDFAPFKHKFGAFTSTVEWDDTPPAGTHYEPTFQAEHKTLYPVFRSSVPGPAGDVFWAVNDSGRPHAHSGPGFGLIYQDGLLFLVGPWYRGLVLNVPAADVEPPEPPPVEVVPLPPPPIITPVFVPPKKDDPVTTTKPAADGLSTGAIVAIVAGVAVVGGGVIFAATRKKKKKSGHSSRRSSR